LTAGRSRRHAPIAVCVALQVVVLINVQTDRLRFGRVEMEGDIQVSMNLRILRARQKPAASSANTTLRF
jgi:hypothetical protein